MVLAFGCMTYCPDQFVHWFTIQFFSFLVCSYLVQLLIWHFFVLTQKSTHAKGIPLGKKVKTKKCFLPHPIAPPPFCRASALEFKDKKSSTGFSFFSLRYLYLHLNWQVIERVQFVIHPLHFKFPLLVIRHKIITRKRLTAVMIEATF